MSSLPPPGWYSDPHRTHSLRWWDGRTWTAAASGTPNSPRVTPSDAIVPKPRRAWPSVTWIAAVLVVAVTGAVLAMVLADRSSDNESVSADQAPSVSDDDGLDLLTPPHDDIELCGLAGVEPLVTHLGGAQTVSIPGSDAATIEQFAEEPSTGLLVGICELTLADGVTRYQVAIGDWRTEEAAATELATRIGMIEGAGNPSPVSVSQLPGVFIDTGMGLVGHVGRYEIGCGLSSTNADGWASSLVRDDCITIVLGLTDLIFRSQS